ncbi:hypothetical protein [Lactobacillus jensenii]|uniref:hypothetical protein n=1 Tax=Lactobacillus jensenii TaxID=109790 RepID=UPI0011968F2B|nr:hypothetical protein [Lactobacillus jensenii]MDK7308830.1 hypothetical protein [Lactobacillus jensenii]TVV22599.1 hypothetical protein FOF69_00570 [Lactobacillus jensenii]
MRKNNGLRKGYFNELNEIDVLKVCYEIQLLDHSRWINIGNSFFKDRVTGDEENIHHLYKYIWRGWEFNGNLICGRKYPHRGKYPLKQSALIIKRRRKNVR